MKQRAIKSILFFTISYMVLCFSFSYAQSDLPLSESNTISYRLDNGLTVIIKEDHRTPTFHAEMLIRAGSATEDQYMASGITHCIEHMIFKGTPKRDAISVEKDIKALGGNIGAYTTYDYTAFNLNGPRESIIPLLEIFYEMISAPKFDKDELKREKDVIKREMRFINDNPGKYIVRQLWRQAYLRHSYRHPIIGYEKIFDQLTQDDIHDYYGRFYVPDNMALVVVGDFDVELARKVIADLFGQLTRKSFTLPVVRQEPKQSITRYKEIPYATSKTRLAMGFHSVAVTDTDLYALDTLAMLLGNGRSSIFYKSLYNRQKLVYGIETYNYTPFNPGLFVIEATLDPKNKSKVIKSILEEIENIKTSPLKKKDIDKVKNQVVSSYIFDKQTQSSQASDLGVSHIVTSNLDFSKHYVNGINKVTSQDIMDVARRYLTKENMTTVLLIPSAIKKIEAKTKVESAPVRKVIKKKLRNGLTLLICEDKTLPIVSIRACMGGGLRVENRENNGISSLAAQMLIKGSGGYKEEELFFLIESMGGNLSAYSANNSFGLSLSFMSKDIKKGIDILSKVLIKPVFPKDAFNSLKKNRLAAIELMNDSGIKVAEKNLRKNLFPSSPYGMLSVGSKESIRSISLRDIKKFYKQYCVAKNMVVAICGDFDADYVYKLANSRLRGIRKGKPVKSNGSESMPIEEEVDIVKKMDKEQSVVMIGFRSTGLSNPDKYPLRILSSIYSGAAGRLFNNIRQKKGLAYTVGAFGMTGVDTGSFIYYAATKKDKIDLVKEEILKDIKKLCKGDLSDEDIDSAKKSLITQKQLSMQSLGSFALKIALDELYGLGFDNYLSFSNIIKHITRKDVLDIANKYFNTEGYVVSVTMPKDE